MSIGRNSVQFVQVLTGLKPNRQNCFDHHTEENPMCALSTARANRAGASIRVDRMQAQATGATALLEPEPRFWSALDATVSPAFCGVLLSRG